MLRNAEASLDTRLIRVAGLASDEVILVGRLRVKTRVLAPDVEELTCVVDSTELL